MEITAHFSEIRKMIIQEIESATEEILIAMAWFTNEQLFDLLISKLTQTNHTIKITLIIINDTINIRSIGLDFQKFIDFGGVFCFGDYENPMHNKYCIIDKKVVVSGSYNYTYLAEQINEENVIRIKGVCDVIDQYSNNFKDLLSGKQGITSLAEYLANNPPYESMLSMKDYGIKDTYQQAVELKSSKRVNDAVKIIEHLNFLSSETPSDQFVINEVVYRQWKQDYYVDKIVVKASQIILHFKTFSDPGSWIYGPNTKHCWLIRDTNNHNINSKVKRIKNIKINGKIMEKEANPGTLYCCEKDMQSVSVTHDTGYKRNSMNQLIDDDGKEVPIILIPVTSKYELRCELHFSKKSFTNTVIDLIEGLEMDKNENHWHCFDINLCLNRQSIN